MAKKKKNKIGTQSGENVAAVEATTAPIDELSEASRKKPAKIKNKVYERELAKLQEELVKLQQWIKDQGLKVVVIFEGRDITAH